MDTLRRSFSESTAWHSLVDFDKLARLLRRSVELALVTPVTSDAGVHVPVLYVGMQLCRAVAFADADETEGLLAGASPHWAGHAVIPSHTKTWRCFGGGRVGANDVANAIRR